MLLMTVPVESAVIDVPLHEFESDHAYTVNQYVDASVYDGVLHGLSTGIDPMLKIIDIDTSYNAVFPTEHFDGIEIRMYVDPSATGPAYFFWSTSNANGFSATRRVDFATTKGGWQTYTLDLSGHSGWTGNLTDIRIDPFQHGNDHCEFKVDFIRLLTSGPGVTTLTPLRMNMLWRKTVGDGDHTMVNTRVAVSGDHDGQIVYVPDTAETYTHPLYRHYHPSVPKDHMMSFDSTTPAGSGYQLESILGYAFSDEVFGTTPIIRQYDGSGRHGTVHFAETLDGYTDELLLGFGYRRYNRQGATSSDFYTKSAGGITVACNLATGGSIWKWEWNGMQYVNNYDLGRQLQSWAAVQVPDAANELGFPAESGAAAAFNKDMTNPHFLQGSPNVYCYSVGDTLITRTVPLENKLSMIEALGGDVNHPLAYTDLILGKELTLNYRDMGPVAKYVLYLSSPITGQFNLIAVDQHLRNNFTKQYQYDPESGTLSELTLGYGEQAGWSDFVYGASIGATEDGNYAFGIIVKSSSSGGSFYDLSFRNWNNDDGDGEFDSGTVAQVANMRSPQFGQSGSYRYTAYMICGTLQDVQTRIDALYAIRDDLEW